MARITRETRETHRAKLLAAAADEFARHGLQGANINRISTAAGLAKGTVYNYFESKEALFLEVVTRACTRAAEGVKGDSAEQGTRARLTALLVSDAAWAREHEAFAKVLIRESLSADTRFYPQVLQAAAPFLQKVTEILEDGVKRNEVRSDAPIPQLALAFLGLVDLALIQYWGTSLPSLDDIPTMVVGLFLEGAAPRSPEDEVKP